LEIKPNTFGLVVPSVTSYTSYTSNTSKSRRKLWKYWKRRNPMAKKKPDGTVTHTIFLPDEVHKQVAAIAGYGNADDLIIECVREAMKPRWAKWLKQELKKSEL
jgi:hypothetical protein